jgi:hypothetical protein
MWSRGSLPSPSRRLVCFPFISSPLLASSSKDRLPLTDCASTVSSPFERLPAHKSLSRSASTFLDGEAEMDRLRRVLCELVNFTWRVREGRALRKSCLTMRTIQIETQWSRSWTNEGREERER